MNGTGKSEFARRSLAAVVCEVFLVTTVAVLSLIVCLHDGPTGIRPAAEDTDQFSHLYSYLFSPSADGTGLR